MKALRFAAAALALILTALSFGSCGGADKEENGTGGVTVVFGESETEAGIDRLTQDIVTDPLATDTQTDLQPDDTGAVTAPDDTTGDKEKTEMKISVPGAVFGASFTDTGAADAFKSILPLTLGMSELNGNEKYAYLDRTLPAKAEKPDRIEAGDIMLYGDDCVVVFYESFDTPYSYTRIGRITDTDGLKAALGKGAVSVTFSLSSETEKADTVSKTVTLNSGYEMPVAGLGTYSLDHDTCVRSVMAHLKNGGRLIDTAYMYGNEDAVGFGAA